MRRNWVTLTVLAAVLLAALTAIVLALADPSTKGRLYGWLPQSSGATTPAAPPPARP